MARGNPDFYNTANYMEFMLASYAPKMSTIFIIRNCLFSIVPYDVDPRCVKFNKIGIRNVDINEFSYMQRNLKY